MTFSVIRHHFATIDSTNDWAKERIDQFDRNALTIVSADQQTAGHGQFGRPWLSPPGNLYASLCFFKGGSDFTDLPLTLAQILCDILHELDIPAAIKPPNDVLVDGRKIAGFLCETVDCGDRRGIVLGVGVNIGLSEEDLRRIDQPATSLRVLGCGGIDSETLLDRLVQKLLPQLDDR